MPIKIENQSSTALPRGTIQNLEKIVESVPRDHLRGIERLRLVNQINDPRVRPEMKSSLPGLYHPKQGNRPAWLELSVGALIQQKLPLHKRLMQRMSFKGNLAATVFSLVGQHYHLTLRHSVKRGQIEGLVRTYAETRLRAWTEGQNSLRTRIFKPLQPRLEKWAKALQKRTKEEKRKQKA